MHLTLYSAPPLAFGWHDSVTEDAASAVHKMRVTEFLAARGSEDVGPESPIMREQGAHLFVRSDAINDAFTVLIDERKPSETERLAIIAALKEASKRVNDEYDKFRREQGLCGQVCNRPGPGLSSRGAPVHD